MMQTIPGIPWLGPGGRKLKPGGRGPGKAPRDKMLKQKFRRAFFYLNHQGWERKRGQALLAARKPKVWEVPQEVPC